LEGSYNRTVLIAIPDGAIQLESDEIECWRFLAAVTVSNRLSSALVGLEKSVCCLVVDISFLFGFIRFRFFGDLAIRYPWVKKNPALDRILFKASLGSIQPVSPWNAAEEQKQTNSIRHVNAAEPRSRICKFFCSAISDGDDDDGYDID
jgi:hypothetical protein